MEQGCATRASFMFGLRRCLRIADGGRAKCATLFNEQRCTSGCCRVTCPRDGNAMNHQRHAAEKVQPRVREIRNLRLLKGWSQRDLAKETQLGPSTISNIEKG